MENYKEISRMLGCLPEVLSLLSSARHADDSTWIKGEGGINNHHIISNVTFITQVRMIVFAIRPMFTIIHLGVVTMIKYSLIKWVTSVDA